MVDEFSQTWVWWFTLKFVWSNSDEGLSFLEKKNLKMSRLLWFSIATRLWINHEKMPDSIKYGKWVSVLIDSASGIDYESLGCLLKSCRHPADKRTMVLLFMHLTNPYLKLKPHFKFSEKDTGTIDADVSIQGENYWLNQSWSTCFKPNLSEYAMVLTPIVENQLRIAHYLLFNFGQANQDYDPLTVRRPAIEPHEQNIHGMTSFILIDAARDILEYLISHNPDYASVIIKSWSESCIPMLEKLAAHGMVKSSQNPDEKIQWVIAKNWLFKSTVKHETFSLLQESYPKSSEPIRQNLLKAIIIGPGLEHDVKQDLANYMKYNLLIWLNRADPHCELVKIQLTEMQKAYPDFQPREHPDMDFWMSSGFRGQRSPLSIEELLAIEPSEAIDFLLCYDDNHFDGPDREGLLEVVGNTASRSYEWSLKLVETLSAVGPPEYGLDLWKHIIYGWKRLL